MNALRLVKVFTISFVALLAGCAPRSQPPLNHEPPRKLLHRVRPGDTLYRVARYFGVSVAALKAANGLSGDVLHPGQHLFYPWPKGAKRYQRGVASWYGPGFNGRRTASGEVFDQEALTAAHPRLPFGSRVLVLRTDNRETVIVRINDRGPFAKGRIIDLSLAAARAIDLDRSGTAEVVLFRLP